MPTILITDDELHLTLHRVTELLVRLEQARYIAERIARAKLVELPGEDHLSCAGNGDVVIAGTENFLAGVRCTPDTDRVLATVLVVGSALGIASLILTEQSVLLEIA